MCSATRRPPRPPPPRRPRRPRCCRGRGSRSGPPAAVVSSLITQNKTVTSGTLAAEASPIQPVEGAHGSSETGAARFPPSSHPPWDRTLTNSAPSRPGGLGRGLGFRRRAGEPGQPAYFPFAEGSRRGLVPPWPPRGGGRPQPLRPAGCWCRGLEPSGATGLHRGTARTRWPPWPPTPLRSPPRSALAHHQRSVSTGVILGSNVFNLAALLGLGAIVAGRTSCTAGLSSWRARWPWPSPRCACSAWPGAAGRGGLVLVLVVLAPYVALLAGPRLAAGQGSGPAGLDLLAHRGRGRRGGGDRPVHRLPPGHGRDVSVGVGALVVVVGASIAMERGAVALGNYFSLSEIVVGALLLAVVTSLPNAVAAGYLARASACPPRSSTALNSNALNPPLASCSRRHRRLGGPRRPGPARGLVVSWGYGAHPSCWPSPDGAGRRSGWGSSAATCSSWWRCWPWPDRRRERGARRRPGRQPHHDADPSV